VSILPKTDPEFKGLIPPLSPEEREQLEQNILQARKCHDAIVLWDGTIIDGHNRYEICVKHGIEFEIVDLPLPSREAAKLWILDNQLGRRNLHAAARIELALVKADILREKAQKKQSLAGGDKKSAEYKKSLSSKLTKLEIESVDVQRDTAIDASVGVGTLHRFMEIKKHGSPQLLAKVQSGELKIGTAHKLLTKEILKQLKRTDATYKYIQDAISEETARQNGVDTSTPAFKANKQAIQARLTQLTATLEELITKLKERSAHDTA